MLTERSSYPAKLWDSFLRFAAEAEFGSGLEMRQFLERAIQAVEFAPWLTRERLLRWGKVCALLSLALLAYDLVAYPANGGTNGRDFFGFWSSSALAAAGRPEAAYVIGPLRTFEQSTMYPPIMMVLCWPLSSFSYSHALLVWVGLGAALYVWSLFRTRRLANGGLGYGRYACRVLGPFLSAKRVLHGRVAVMGA